MSKWIIEFDYSADPEVSSDTVRANLFEMLSIARGPFRVERQRVEFEDTDDALGVRMRFDGNIVACQRA